jgi:hypothetical protein
LENALFWAFIIVFVYLIGLPALDNFFIHDDPNLIWDTKVIFDKPLKLLKTYNMFFRPAVRLTLYPFAQAFGNNPAPYYHLNLWVHIINVILVYTILGAFRIGVPGRFLGTTAFGLNIIYLEVYRFISNFNELSFAFFFLLAVYLYVRSDKTRHFAAFAFLLTAFSKETGIVLPFVLLAYEILIRRGPWHDSIRRFAPVAVAWVIYVLIFVLRCIVIGRFIHTNYNLGLHGLYNLALNLIFVITTPLYNIALTITSGPGKYVIFSGGLILIAVFLIFYAVKKRKDLKYSAGPIFFGLAWTIVTLLPAGFWQGFGTGAGRYFYIPYVGVAIIFATVINILLPSISKRGKVGVAVGLIGFGVLVATLSYRAGLYEKASSVYERWYDTVRTAGPESTDYIILSGSGRRLSSVNILHGSHDVFLYKIMFPHAAAAYLNIENRSEAREFAASHKPSVLIYWSDNKPVSVDRYE